MLVAFLVFGLARPAVSAPRLVPGFEVLAATGPKLLVLVAPLDGPARTQAGLLEHTAESAVKAQGRFALLRSADALDGRAARARQDAAEKARKLDKEGRQKLDDLDAVAGAATLGEALAAWRASDLTEHFKDFTTTWSARGGAYATGDENVRARQDIERILVVAPDAQFSNAYYPPDLLKYAEGLRKQAATASGELTVRSEPVGARIWVDGVYRGVAPATIKGLPNGRHFVTALLAGRSMWQSEVALGEEPIKLEPAEGAANWTRTLEKLGKDPDGPGRDTAAREVAAATGAEQVLLLVAKKSVNGNQLELTGIRIEAKDGHNLSYAKKVVPMDSAEAADAFLAALLEKDAPRKEGKPVTHFDGSGGGVHPTRRIVGLSIAGAGVLLAGTGALFGGLALGKQDEYRRTVQTDTVAATAIADQGRAFAVVCDITLITGLVAAAFGSVAGFTTIGQNWFQPKEGGEPPPPEPKKEEPAKKEEPKKDKEPAKKDELKKEEPKKEEPKKEEPKKEEPRKEEPKKTKAQEAEERKKKEAEEKKAKEEEEKRKKEEEKKAKEDEKRKKEEEEKRKKEEEKKAKEDEKRRKEEEKKGGDKKKKEEEEAKKKAEEEAALKKKAEDEAAARKAEEDKKKKEEEAKKKKAEEEAAAKKKAEEDAARKKKEEEAKKKKDEDHDDLKNY